MELINLLKKGHFPKELPPPFTTKYFADFYIKNNHLLPKPRSSSRGTRFSCPRVGITRKSVFITNPEHQTTLFNYISLKWREISLHYTKSKLSYSKPHLLGNRASNLPSFKDFRRRCFEESYCHRYELKTDISKYYPSIYTHSIPWALHTKEASKNNVNSKLKINNIGDWIDKYIRLTQHSQTIGIPVGPDSSHIISEIIGTSIDEHLQNKFPNLVGFRYVDDIYLYFSTYAEAELCLKEIQQIFREFELQISGEKTKITELPQGIEEDWIINLRKFNFDTNQLQQQHDLYSFFSLAFDYSQKYKDKFVLSYAIRRISNEFIYYSNFSLYESLLYKTIISESSTLPDVLSILLSYKNLIDLQKLKNTLQTIIEYACPRGFDFEVSWSLWYILTFKIKIDCKISKILENLIDPISMLLTLDLIEQKLIIEEDLKLASWENQINNNCLRDDKWILAYEIALKGWLLTKYDYIEEETSLYFKILKKNKITFYDNTLQVEVKNNFNISSKKSEKIHTLNIEHSEYD